MAKLTRKSYQRKAMVVGATAFAGIALVATGFAAWVISSSAKQNVQGNVQVGVVSDKSIKLTVDSITQPFSFDCAANDNTGRVRWDGTNSENLSITVKGNYTNPDMVNKFSIALRMGTVSEAGEPTFETDVEQRFKDAQTANYIVLPECFGETGVNFDTKNGSTTEGKKLTISEEKAEFEYTISFKWGNHFKGTKGGELQNLNPSEYYDSPEGLNAYDDTKYEEDLQKFFKALTGKDAGTEAEIKAGFATLNFVVVVTADTSGAAA